MIIGFYKNVQLRFSISKPESPKQYLKSIGISEDSTGNSFEMNGLKGKNIVSNKPKYYNNVIYLASDDYFYQVSVIAKVNSKKEIVHTQAVARFINSIKVNGQQLIVPEKPDADTNDKIVSTSSLKTSPEVLQALERKPDKSKIKFSYFPASALELDKDSDEPERLAIILARPSLNVRNDELSEVGSRSVTLQISYLTNGQIGDVAVFSDAPKSLIYRTTALLKNIKFIPAMNNGQYVDSKQTSTYHFAG